MAFFVDKFKKRPTDQYMMSPLTRTQNFFNNSYELAKLAQDSKKNPFVKPVFTDNEQRSSFANTLAEEKSTVQSALNKNKKDKEAKRNLAALTFLEQQVSAKGAQYQLPDQDDAVVWVQGHGMPGRQTLTSDPYVMTKTEATNPGWREITKGDYWRNKDIGLQLQSQQGQIMEHADVARTARKLRKMGVKPSMDIRANSCHSATQNRVFGLSAQDVKQRFKKHELISQTGDWSETFAGGLQFQLNIQQHTSEYGVKGYIGPTTQSPAKVIDRNLKRVKNPELAVSIATTNDYNKNNYSRLYIPKNEAMRSQPSRLGNIFSTTSVLPDNSLFQTSISQGLVTNVTSKPGNKGRKN